LQKTKEIANHRGKLDALALPGGIDSWNSPN
jgi:hypothetical protein